MAKPVTATGPSGKTRTFASQRALANTLSGNGDFHASERVRQRVMKAVRKGGDFVGNTYVTSA